LVRFTDQRAEYCNPSCVLGAGVVGEAPSRGGGSAVGVGYGDDSAAVTFAHELGHVYGRPHTPCNVQGDPDYPYRAGGIGSWGYDIFDETMMDPASYKDLMGYCTPVWISDYVYGHLQSFLIDAASPPTTDGGVDAGSDAAAIALPMESSRMYRTLLREPDATLRWGRVRGVRGEPNGSAELADVLDRQGRVIESVRVYRSRVADVGRSYVYVPEPPSASWWSIRLKGEVAQPYGHGSVPPVLRGAAAGTMSAHGQL
jgi:hypothetical protein